MTQVALDEVMLREPRLLVPRRQPLGPVRVDPAHPLARGLIYADLPTAKLAGFPSKWLYASAAFKTNYGDQLIYSTGASATAASRGLYQSADDSALIRSAIAKGTGLSVLAVTAAPSTESASDFLFSDAGTNAAGPYNWGIYRSNSTDKYVGYVKNASASVQSVAQTTTYAIGPVFHAVLMTYDGATIRLFIDGWAEGEQAQTGAVSALSSSGEVLQQGRWLSTSTYTLFLNAFLAVWNRGLTPAEGLDLTGNCYQFLIPA